MLAEPLSKVWLCVNTLAAIRTSGVVISDLLLTPLGVYKTCEYELGMR